MSDSDHRQLLQYLKYVGGLTMRDAFNNCLKECLTDQCCMKYTYRGTSTCQSFYDKKIATAIYEAVAANRHLLFRPTLAHFEEEMKECIRTAKQRYRNSLKLGERNENQHDESALKQKRMRARRIYESLQKKNNELERNNEQRGNKNKEHKESATDEEDRGDEDEEYEESATDEEESDDEE